MAKDVNLLSYWMPILRNLKEFKEIAKAEEPELIALLEAIDRTLANMYIETADEYGIKRFEDMMRITPDAEDSLEIRRFNVLTKWGAKAMYTDEELYNTLSSLCGGADKFQIIQQYDEYLIKIITYLGVRGVFGLVQEFLTKILPCNLILDLQNVLAESSKTTSVNTVLVTSTAMSYLITNDISERVKTSDEFTIASPVSTASVLTLN